MRLVVPGSGLGFGADVQDDVSLTHTKLRSMSVDRKPCVICVPQK